MSMITLVAVRTGFYGNTLHEPGKANAEFQFDTIGRDGQTLPIPKWAVEKGKEMSAAQKAEAQRMAARTGDTKPAATQEAVKGKLADHHRRT